ncbi:hypothetical protein BHE74_00018373 [Ensete ventricosum]|nr:hypothetical protein BHE74_00018373 [Ensete ventricosum]
MRTRSCGDVHNIKHPFWFSEEQSHGPPGFEVECKDNRLPVLVSSSEKSYSILQIFYHNRSLWVNNTKLAADDCPNLPSVDVQFGLDDHFFISNANRELFLFHHCSGTGPVNSTRIECAHDDVYAELGGNYCTPPDPSCRCKVLATAPVFNPGEEKETSDWYEDLLKKGFLVEWCEDERRCGSDNETGAFVCHPTQRRDDPSSCSKSRLHPPQGRDDPSSRRVCVGVGCLAAGSLLCWVYVYRRKRPQPSASSVLLARPAASTDPESVDEQYYTQVFTYEELEAATDGFSASNKLGDGGFGVVYKASSSSVGKLLDGRTVAIKRFYRNNYRLVEQFVTEASILSALRHQHLVVLYGCTSRRSRELILVYEYVPNGTVADHLHGPRAGEAALAWPLRMRVAVEIAVALSYLHATTPQIIHRDVKTSNILLDVGFHVKVADFGLSRLFPANATHVSTVPQGTPGYVDPDYHRCFQLTDKSDVYSFGVVLAELISSKPAVDVTRQRHDMNLAAMAVSKIQNQELEQLVDPQLWCQSQKSETRTMIEQVAEVAFRCLQAETDMRPTIKEVLEALKAIQDEGYNRAEGVEADAAANDEDCLLGNKVIGVA